MPHVDQVLSGFDPLQLETLACETFGNYVEKYERAAKETPPGVDK
jgi:hypothetical protein